MTKPWVALTKDDPDSRGWYYVIAWQAENGVRGHMNWPEQRVRDLYLLLRDEFEATPSDKLEMLRLLESMVGTFECEHGEDDPDAMAARAIIKRLLPS